MNPVLGRELRARFRSRGSGVLVTAWLLALGGVGYLVYRLARAMVSGGAFGPFSPLMASASMGRMMFESLLILLMTAVVFVVPGLGALGIVGERERQTLHLLQVTQLHPRHIVLGKLGSSLAYLVLLLVAAAPFLVVPSLFGGVTVGEALGGLAAVVATAAVLGSLALWSSARSGTTRGAVAGAYAWAFALAFGTLLLLAAEIFLVVRSDPDPFLTGDGREVVSVWLNPYVATVSAMGDPPRPGSAFAGPLVPVQYLLAARQGRLAEGPGWPGDGDPPPRGPLWTRSLAAGGAVALGSLLLAGRAVQAPQGRLRGRRR